MEVRYTKGNISVTITVEAPVALQGSDSDANASLSVTIMNSSEGRTWDPMLYTLAVPESDRDTSVINKGEWPTGFPDSARSAGIKNCRYALCKNSENLTEKQQASS